MNKNIALQGSFVLGFGGAKTREKKKNVLR
jgi:hypothetical protein